MSEEIPRRMQRFYRKKMTESQVKEKSAQIAVAQVDSFVRHNSRYPNKDEMNKIAENVFDQLKSEIRKEEEERKNIEDDIDLGPQKPNDAQSLARQRRERRRSGKEEEKQEPGQEQEPAEMPEPAQEEAPQGPEDAGQNISLEEIDEDTKNVEKLAEVEELSSMDSDLSQGDYDNIEKEMDSTVNSCPRCNSKTPELIFCPKCGEAFCDHCAKGIEAQKDFIKYVCPKCLTEFKKRKSR